ncbi:hypothetical protein BDW59DRAFT_159079 [Aspergillus cavernicola]|uniref:Fungal STAND N-terminal Goodbye domain-containing protein n=1 Tax=Aspergillus cavernicola TaxID=176166 RepID=A0ABR4INZ4_9EURO
MSMQSESEESAPTSVQEIWEKTIIRFQGRTGQRLDGVSKGPDDLRRALDAHYASQAEDEDVSKAKAVGFQMIHCIQLLGGIVAEGASMVFGPAGMCFNALSFLLDIPKKVHEFHGEINAIFAEVGPALAQFRIYQRMEESSQIDEALRVSIYQVMTSFVDLCANCINIHHEGRWKTFRRHAKRVLLDDGSVQGELDNFKKLTQDQLNIQATLTLEVAVETGQYVKFIKTATVEIDTNTKAIKSDVSGLVEAEHKRTLDDTRKQSLSSIKAKLGQKDEKIAAVLEARDTMWKSSVQDSGKWLNEVDEYKQWIDRTSAAESVLLLTGDPGTGKSFLVSAIAQEIKSANSVTKAERSLIGYHSFSIAEKGDSDRQRPEAAIKSICAQLAEQDIVYAKHVSSVCSEAAKDEKWFRDASCESLWTALGIGAPAKNTTHYILLDSISTLNAEERARLTQAIQHNLVRDGEQEKSNRLRILVSGEPAAFQEGSLSSSSTKTIDIAKYNEGDIKAFIVQELQKADLFQGGDDDSQRRKNMVEERLIKRSNNLYSTVQQDLSKIKEIIASSGTEEELNRALQESSTDPKALVRSDIETLEALLKPREIEEINELLIWAVAGPVYLYLEQLTAALFLRFNTVSLQPLVQKITGKYSKIFILTFGGEYLGVKDLVEDCIVSERDRPRQSVDDPKITATISITNGDVKAVQRFFWDLNHYSFLDGFAFQPGSDFPDAGKRKIQLNVVDAHLEIVKRAFSFFLQPAVDERGKGLGSYLMGYIPFHLNALYEASGLDELLLGDKQYIGSHVYEMFNEGDLIERNWEFCEGASWFQKNDDLEIFWKWLDDPVAIGRLGPRDKRWLAELKTDERRNSSLLTPIMTVVAKNWLQRSEWDVETAFNWISGFLALGVKPEPQDSDLPEQDDGHIIIHPNDSTVEMIAKSEQWCKQALKVSEVDYTWCIRLGATYDAKDENDAAIEEYKKAATILQSQDPVNKEQLRDVFKALGEWSTDPEIALQYLKQASQQDEANVEILYMMLQGYVATRQEDEAQSIIQKAITEKVPGTESTFLIAMLRTAVSKQDETDLLSVFKAIFSLISSSPEWWTVFQQELEAAIGNARKANKYDELAMLLFQLGSALYYLRRDSPEQLATAAGHWRECLATIREKVNSKDRKRLDFIEENAIMYLSMFHVEKAMKTDGEESEKHVKILRQIYEDDPTSLGPKSVLASFYTFKGQRNMARDLFRADMVQAFNLLFDRDIGNDDQGFEALRSLLHHTGDYESATRAGLMLPLWHFSDTVLQEFLAGREPSLEAASAELLQFYHRECPSQNKEWDNFQEVRKEAKRLASQAEEGSEMATCYQRVDELLDQLSNGIDYSFSCNNCDRAWDYDNSMHVCKYCYNMDLCDVCWNELQSGETGKALACSRTHDWWEAEPWTMEKYIRACNRLVTVTAEDGSEELISASKWLGTLCEEWGLSKTDWDFE